MYITQSSPTDVQMSGWLKSKLKKGKSKLAKKLSTMPKWKRMLIAATGLGLVAPATATTAMVAATTVGVPTLATAKAVMIAKQKALPRLRQVRQAIAAKRAAKKAVPPELIQEEQALVEVASTQVPETAASSQAKASSLATVVPLASVGIGLLSLLTRK